MTTPALDDLIRAAYETQRDAQRQREAEQAARAATERQALINAVQAHLDAEPQHEVLEALGLLVGYDEQHTYTIGRLTSVMATFQDGQAADTFTIRLEHERGRDAEQTHWTLVYFGSSQIVPLGRLVPTVLAAVGERRAARAETARERARQDAQYARAQAQYEQREAAQAQARARLETENEALVAEATAHAWAWPAHTTLTYYRATWCTGLARDVDGACYAQQDSGYTHQDQLDAHGYLRLEEERFTTPRLLRLRAEHHLPIFERLEATDVADLPSQLLERVEIGLPRIYVNAAGEVVRDLEDTVPHTIGQQPMGWIRDLLASQAGAS